MNGVSAATVRAEELAAQTARRGDPSDIEVLNRERNSGADHKDQRPTVYQLKDQILRLTFGHIPAHLFERFPVLGRISHLVGDAAIDNGDPHNNLLTLHGLLTRHVTGAFLTASRSLQRKAWVRRAAAPVTRPSDTTTGGAR